MANPPADLLVPPELAGQRLDLILAALLPGMTRTALQRLIRNGGVLLDGVPARPSDKPAAGQSIRVGQASRLPGQVRRLSCTPEAQDIPLDIIYEDGHLLVVNKPPEMVVHPAKGHYEGTLVNALLAHSRLSTAGDAIRPGIVHRLDRHTSGLLLVAKTDQALAELSRQVETREVRREYHALVWGQPSPPQGTIHTGFGRHPQHRTMMAVREQERGRAAVTHYRTLECFAWAWTPSAAERPRRRQAALVECVLDTGRTHQIRVHLAHLGCPIVRDPLYGDPVRDAEEPPDLATLLQALPGQALHAARLTFHHPISGDLLTLDGPPPPAFATLLTWLRDHPVQN